MRPGGEGVAAATVGLAAGVKATQVKLSLDKLAWDYTQRYGQIRPLTDGHVEEIRRSLVAAPPTSYVNVTVVAADPIGMPPHFPPLCCVARALS
jgi:hypothetical protein